jgi:hypothetical protein
MAGTHAEIIAPHMRLSQIGQIVGEQALFIVAFRTTTEEAAGRFKGGPRPGDDVLLGNIDQTNLAWMIEGRYLRSDIYRIGQALTAVTLMTPPCIPGSFRMSLRGAGPYEWQEPQD